MIGSGVGRRLRGAARRRRRRRRRVGDAGSEAAAVIADLTSGPDDVLIDHITAILGYHSCGGAGGVGGVAGSSCPGDDGGRGRREGVGPFERVVRGVVSLLPIPSSLAASGQTATAGAGASAGATTATGSLPSAVSSGPAGGDDVGGGGGAAREQRGLKAVVASVGRAAAASVVGVGLTGGDAVADAVADATAADAAAAAAAAAAGSAAVGRPRTLNMGNVQVASNSGRNSSSDSSHSDERKETDAEAEAAKEGRDWWKDEVALEEEGLEQQAATLAGGGGWGSWWGRGKVSRQRLVEEALELTFRLVMSGDTAVELLKVDKPLVAALRRVAEGGQRLQYDAKVGQCYGEQSVYRSVLFVFLSFARCCW